MRCVTGAAAGRARRNASHVCAAAHLVGRETDHALDHRPVDDDPEYRLIGGYILAPVSDTMTIVGEASDGEEALAIVLRERPDIVITDLAMPRLNGVELTRRLRQELPATKIILISSYTEDAYRLMASDSGADAFVSKQVIDGSLLPGIRDVAARRLSGGSGPLPTRTRERQRGHKPGTRN